MRYAEAQQKLFAEMPYDYPLPPQAGLYPELRYMGSKNRLLPWIYGVLKSLDFDSAADPFLGSGCVAYLLKSMGKRVIGSDFLNFPTVIAKAMAQYVTAARDEALLRALLPQELREDSLLGEGIRGTIKVPELHRGVADVYISNSSGGGVNLTVMALWPDTNGDLAHRRPSRKPLSGEKFSPEWGGTG